MSTISQRALSATGAAALLLACAAADAHVVFDHAVFDDRTLFEAELGTILVDDYENAGYAPGQGDQSNTATRAIFTNAGMTAVIGETAYTTTGFANDLNIVQELPGNRFYCSGCNGSYMLDFTSTSVGGTNGVFGVGFDFFNGVDDQLPPFHAFVTFGDGTTTDITLPLADISNNQLTGFFGITAERGIESLHLGAANGAPTSAGNFGHDNLTLGADPDSTSIPEPATLLLLAGGLVGLGAVARTAPRNRHSETVRG